MKLSSVSLKEFSKKSSCLLDLKLVIPTHISSVKTSKDTTSTPSHEARGLCAGSSSHDPPGMLGAAAQARPRQPPRPPASVACSSGSPPISRVLHSDSPPLAFLPRPAPETRACPLALPCPLPPEDAKSSPKPFCPSTLFCLSPNPNANSTFPHTSAIPALLSGRRAPEPHPMTQVPGPGPSHCFVSQTLDLTTSTAAPVRSIGRTFQNHKSKSVTECLESSSGPPSPPQCPPHSCHQMAQGAAEAPFCFRRLDRSFCPEHHWPPSRAPRKPFRCSSNSARPTKLLRPPPDKGAHHPPSRCHSSLWIPVPQHAGLRLFVHTSLSCCKASGLGQEIFISYLLKSQCFSRNGLSINIY